MKMTASVWIDHRKAVIAIVSGAGEETMEIRSNVEKQPGRIDGVRSMAPYEEQLVKADDRHEREYTGHLASYYARVFEAIRHAKAILIFGPGEAKGELKKHLEHGKLEGQIVAVEPADKMTDPQIMAKARDFSQKQSGSA